MLRFFQNMFQRQAAKSMFARWSPIYELEVLENHYSAADCVAISAIKHLAAFEIKNPQIADIGIGTGLLAQQLRDALPCRITGLDFSDDMMAVCAAKQVAELLVKCDVGKDIWPLADGSFDALVSAGLFEYLTPDMLQHFLKETPRILRKDGLIVFTYLPSDKNEKMGLWRGHSGTYLTCGYAPAHMESLILKAGMTVIEHSEPFRGCLFEDGSSYDYRLIAARKN